MPGTPSRKRKSSAQDTTPSDSDNNAAGSSSKKRASRGKRKPDTVINLDVDDPFSFDAKADSHPEPLTHLNISVERTAFGGVKFSRSPPSSSDRQRYASLEKLAERRGNVSGGTSSLNRPTPLSSSQQLDVSSSSRGSTPKSRNTKKREAMKNQSSSEAYQLDDDDEDMESTDESVKGKSKQTSTPGSGKRSARRSTVAEAVSSIQKEKITKEEDLYKVPELNPIEQLEVDQATEEHKLLEAGARVLALWGHEFYAAYVCGRDGLSRYLVHFVEDNLNRPLPPTGVIPLAILSVGHKVSYIATVDDEEVGKTAEIVNTPSNEDAEEWVEGLFEVREEDEDEGGQGGQTKKIHWEKIYLSKEQRAKINVSTTNTTVMVDRENIVNESRSSRRSRTTRFSAESIGANTSSQAAPPSAERSVRAPRTPRTPKTPNKPASETENEAKDTEDESITVKTPTSTSRRRSNRASTGGNPSTTANRNRESAEEKETPHRNAHNQPEKDVEEDEPEEKPMPEENEIEAPEGNVEAEVKSDEAGDIEEAQPEEVEETLEIREETKVEISIEEQLTPPQEEETSGVEEEIANEIIETAEEPLAKENQEQVQSTQEVAEVINGNSYEKINGAENAAQGPSQNGSSSPTQRNSASKHNEDSIELSNNTTSPTDTALPEKQPAKIFDNTKFVLTSATRSKKNSDFNKRDYRAKIEERGGIMIDDFSALQEGEMAFLIADTYYRTHKYLSALSLSVPCVKHNWILECVTNDQLVDYLPFMLPAGESTLDPEKIYDWKPLKGQLLRDKKVWVYSNLLSKGDDRVLGFVDIWSSIISNLGATLVGDMPSGISEKLERCNQDQINILLSDVTCEKAIAERIEAEGGIAVSSEWVIQAIVTGELPDVSTNPRFRFDSAQ